MIEMTSRAIAFAPPNLQSSSVLEQMSCIHIKIALWISLLTWGTFSMLLTTRAAKLVKCEQLHTTSQDPGENTVSQPWFIQSEDVQECTLLLILHYQQTFYTEIPTHTLCTYKDLVLYVTRGFEGCSDYMLFKVCLHHSVVTV